MKSDMPPITERARFISHQATLALAIARAWFADIDIGDDHEKTYEGIRVWILARLAERGIGDDEIELKIELAPETKRAMFNFRMLKEEPVISTTVKA